MPITTIASPRSFDSCSSRLLDPKGLHVVVDDVEAVKKALTDRGVETSEVEVQPWGLFIYFSDPDGNTWSVQQIPNRT
jgi:uncharacterized glyoxalase superfamily protein PhnB